MFKRLQDIIHISSRIHSDSLALKILKWSVLLQHNIVQHDSFFALLREIFDFLRKLFKSGKQLNCHDAEFILRMCLGVDQSSFSEDEVRANWANISDILFLLIQCSKSTDRLINVYVRELYRRYGRSKAFLDTIVLMVQYKPSIGQCTSIEVCVACFQAVWELDLPYINSLCEDSVNNKGDGASEEILVLVTNITRLAEIIIERFPDSFSLRRMPKSFNEQIRQNASTFWTQYLRIARKFEHVDTIVRWVSTLAVQSASGPTKRLSQRVPWESCAALIKRAEGFGVLRTELLGALDRKA